MKLEDYQERRAVIAEVQAPLDLGAKVPVWPLTVRDTPTTEAGNTPFTVTPTADGLWRADEWYSEPGGPHSIGSVVARSVEAAIDWAWWASTRKYKEKFVVPSDEQSDRTVLKTYGLLARMGGTRPAKVDYARLARPHWADTTTNPVALGILANLLADSLAPIAMRLARNPRTPRQALASMRRNTSTSVRWQLAGNPSAPPRALQRLRATADFGVCWYLARRPETPTSDIVEWAHDDPALWTDVLGREDATPADLAWLDTASSGALRIRMIGHPSISPELLALFARESDVDLGLALLESGRLSAADLEVVVARAAGWSTYLLGNHVQGRSLHLDPVTLHMLVSSDILEERLVAAAAESLAGSDFEALAADSNHSVRVVLAGRTGLPAEYVDRLAGDKEWPVREAIARNRSIGGEVIGRLARDDQRLVARAALRNHSIPRAVLEELSEHPDVEIARAAKSSLRSHR